jgi:hypothetical protein
VVDQASRADLSPHVRPYHSPLILHRRLGIFAVSGLPQMWSGVSGRVQSAEQADADLAMLSASAS